MNTEILDDTPDKAFEEWDLENCNENDIESEIERKICRQCYTEVDIPSEIMTTLIQSKKRGEEHDKRQIFVKI
uniref:Uncharacterized protein n=1 Tax=Glossina palpalis gambiensis TaxID=67801 RepID=A0A1B0BGB9_9MUSC